MKLAYCKLVCACNGVGGNFAHSLKWQLRCLYDIMTPLHVSVLIKVSLISFMFIHLQGRKSSTE